MPYSTTSATLFVAPTAVNNKKTPLLSQHIQRLRLKMDNENSKYTHEQPTKAMNNNNNGQQNL